MGKPFFKYEYTGYHGCFSVCDLEIHKNLVICSSRADNKGTSITNMAEQLATDICKQFDITARDLIWIEHYREEQDARGHVWREETFSLVCFNLTGGGILSQNEKAFEFSNPRWITLSKAVVDALMDAHREPEEPPIDEWNDGRDFDEPYATEPSDKV